MTRSASWTALVCAYNPDLDLLGRAINSIATQTKRPDELIIVDDGSDQPLELDTSALPFAARIVRHPQNLNHSTALNTGVREARGEFVATLDADDEWMPEHLDHSALAWERHGSSICLLAVRPVLLDVSLGRRVPTSAARPGAVDMADFRRVLHKGLTMSWSLASFRKDVYETVGGCDTSLMRCQDWDYWLNATAKTGLPVGLLDEPLTLHRVAHRSSYTAYWMLRVYDKWRREIEEGRAPAVDGRKLARLSQRHRLNVAYRAAAMGDRNLLRESLEQCLREPGGKAPYRFIAALSLRAPGLLKAAGTYRKMLSRQIPLRLRPTDPRWER